MEKTLIEWIPVSDGYPPRDDEVYYGDRYSVPVMVCNSISGQIAQVAYMWDYKGNGWVDVMLSEGTDPEDYEVQYVDHWALWPEVKPTKGGE